MMPAEMPLVTMAIVARGRLLREALARRLAAEPGLVVLAACQTVTELLAVPGASQVRVLLVVAGHPGDWEVFGHLPTLLPQAQRVVLLDGASTDEAFRYLQAGALACVDRSASVASLVEAIRAAAEGRPAASGAVLAAVIRRLREVSLACQAAARLLPASLSDRETEVARLVARGLSNKQIARQLQIRVSTVKTLVHRILKKLQLKKRRDVMLRMPWCEAD